MTGRAAVQYRAGIVVAVVLAGVAAHAAINTTAATPAKTADSTGVSCRQLVTAVRQQESGGNYRARNPQTGAAGAYQVMPSNIGPWSRQVLGRRVGMDEWLASPRIQDQVAGEVLTSYCRRYGPRGAAAAWFSGRPELADDPKPRGGGAASVKAYVDSVIAIASR